MISSITNDNQLISINQPKRIECFYLGKKIHLKCIILLLMLEKIREFMNYFNCCSGQVQPQQLTIYPNLRDRHYDACHSNSLDMKYQEFQQFINNIGANQKISQYFYKQIQILEPESRDVTQIKIVQWLRYVQQKNDEQIGLMIKRMKQKVGAKCVQEWLKQHNVLKKKHQNQKQIQLHQIQSIRKIFKYIQQNQIRNSQRLIKSEENFNEDKCQYQLKKYESCTQLKKRSFLHIFSNNQKEQTMKKSISLKNISDKKNNNHSNHHQTFISEQKRFQNKKQQIIITEKDFQGKNNCSIIGNQKGKQSFIQKNTESFKKNTVNLYQFRQKIIKKLSIKCLELNCGFADIKKEYEEGQICYMRHMGRQWQYITPMYKGKVNQYCTGTCFVVILKDSDNESFQKNVLQKSKEPTIGDIYTVRDKQQCDIYVIEHTKNGQIKCRILDNQRQTVIAYSKQQLISKYVKRNISMEQVSIKSKFGGGLTNLGNACYMNSVIQIILHLRIPNLFNQKKPFGRILKDIVKKIYNHNTSMRPTDLKKFVDKQMSRFAGYNQQDAHQFLIAVFQRLSEQNRSVVDEYFTGQTQRTLTCIDCKHIERIKDTANVFSIPMQVSGLNVKILFIDNEKHSMIEFSISRYSTVTQWLYQFKHAAKIGLKDEFAVFRMYSGQIIEQFTYDSQKRYVNLNIDNSDSIVAYLLYKMTQNTSKCMKSQIYYESIQNNQFGNKSTIVQNTSKTTLIKVFNYDQTYYEYMNYPFCFKLHPSQFIYAIRMQIKQIVGFKKDINMKVFKKNTQKCHFCQKCCLDSKCFETNSHKVIGQLDNLVTYVIEWKSQKDYKQHIITVKQQKRQITKQQMDLQKSLTKMKKIQRVQFDCEKCNHYQLDSSQIILNTPIILSFQLKRFIVRDKNIIKLHTKWNLQYNIELCGHKYKLRGVILHLGKTSDSGHYIAVIDGVKYDDQKVSYFSFDKIDTSQIFILFYQRILC